MDLRTLVIIILLLYLIPIALGKVDASPLTEVFKNPSQLDGEVVKFVLLDLTKDVINYYKTELDSLINSLIENIKEQLEKKELEIKVR